VRNHLQLEFAIDVEKEVVMGMGWGGDWKGDFRRFGVLMLEFYISRFCIRESLKIG